MKPKKLLFNHLTNLDKADSEMHASKVISKVEPGIEEQSDIELTPVNSMANRSPHPVETKGSPSFNQTPGGPSKKFTYTCSGCNKAIKRDRYLLMACDKYWHENCLRCDKCRRRLGELGTSLFCKSNMNLCQRDYLEMFGRTGICSVCDKLIRASDMVMRAKQYVYHLDCFACHSCNERFCVGDSFYLSQNKVICHDCQVYKANLANSIMSGSVYQTNQVANLNEPLRQFELCSNLGSTTGSLWDQNLESASGRPIIHCLEVSEETTRLSDERDLEAKVPKRLTEQSTDEENTRELSLEPEVVELAHHEAVESKVELLDEQLPSGGSEGLEPSTSGEQDGLMEAD